MPREQLKPGEHGKFSFAPTPDGQVRARARVCLLDNSVVQVTRIGKNDSVALSKLQKAITERIGAARGSEALAPNSKVGLACRQWIDDLRERSQWPDPPVRPQTVDEYERLLGNHVDPYLGHYRLNQLTPAICQAWVDGIVRRGKEGGHDMVATAIQAHGRFADVIDRAVVHDALRDNPVRKVKTPKPKTPRPVALTVMTVGQLRWAVRSWEKQRKGLPGPKPTGHLPAAVDLMLGTGLRIGEVMALRWGAVDLSGTDQPTVQVEATLVDIKGQGTVRQEQPKTDAGGRTIIVPPFVVESLEMVRPAGANADAPVFPSRMFKDGRNVDRPQTTHNMRRSLRAALENAKMTGQVHPHKLRSTVATEVARKMKPADAAALLGHKIDTGITARHYIEQLRLAPDTSAVLQAMVEIGDETWERERRRQEKAAGDASAGPAPTADDRSGTGW
ncbi:tyrosine-type recombinase/integrase [Promicromonospora sp. NPDC050880]|uniref:tyrosine-type recombinase/integrase n=1 Tax=Promicromonospora sp. NPDC050880 TaxID=3364406 RepID=UPI0037A70772